MSKPKPATSPSLADITADITPAEQVVSICVAGSLYAEHQRLEKELADARDEPRRTINAESPAKEIAERIVAIEAEMQAKTYEFTLRQIDRKRWRELLADHPSKNGRGLFGESFIPAAVQASCVEPSMADDDEFDAFWDKLGAGQDTLFDAAWAVNQVGVSVPFSVAASVLLRPSTPSSTTAQE